MENHPIRPTWLPYRAKDGIVETFLGPDSPDETLHSFFDRAISWSKASEKGSFRLLDSFFSDTLTVDLLAEVFLPNPNSAHTPTRILIVDPGSDFALARAKSIKQVAAKEVRSGICNILNAIRKSLGDEPSNFDSLSFSDLLNNLNDLASRVALEVRFYSEVPSGPHYFFKDILLSGRFCAGKSSSTLPWTMIIDNPSFSGDIYDVYSHEFERIWRQASPKPEQRLSLSESSTRPIYDLAIITATEVEWSSLFGLPRVKWRKVESISAGSSILYETKFENSGREISVVATRQADPGMVCASIATTHLLQIARVSFLAVVGICAAVPTKASIGSIVLANYVFDAQAGKFVDGVLQPNIDSITLDRTIFQTLRDRSRFYREEAVKACERLRPRPKPGKFRIAPGRVATVSQVIADSDYAKQIWSQSRQCVALDMESYGVFRAAEEINSERRPRSLFIKTAVDFADGKKSDRYQKYGAALSAHFLWNFALDHLAQ